MEDSGAAVTEQAARPREILVITGLSGAGRTAAAGVLEDHGWYVVDNLPPRLIGAVVGMMTPSGDGVTHLAVVVDVRSRQFLGTLVETLEALRASSGFQNRIVFLDCSDEVLVRRYERVRRPHPLQDGDTILQGIARERRLLASLRARADVIIDTSDLSVHDLARRMERFTETEGRTGPDLQVSVESFGFKYGLPLDANFVLDVRFLDNPYWIDELRHLNGLDQPVRDYVLGLPGAGEFIDRYTSALLLALKGSAEQRQRHVTVAVGCTGGKHRSVAIAEAIAGLVARAGYHVQAHHRDLGRE